MAITLLQDATATGAGGAVSSTDGEKGFQFYGSTSSGTGSATITLEISNDGGTVWTTVLTQTLALTTTAAGSAVGWGSPYDKMRANVTAISGTGAKVSVYMSV